MPTSLADKLQLKTTRQLVTINAPVGYAQLLSNELKGIDVSTEPTHGAGAVLLFVNNLAEAGELAPKAVESVREDGLLWIAYPKGGSGVKTDVNRDKLWPLVSAVGWRPVRQVAIDDVWSGMRFRPGVWERPGK